MPTRVSRSWTLLLPAALLAGCAIGPNYKRPDTQAPATYRGDAQEAKDSLADLSWWDLFKDPQLRDLVHTAVGEGFDVRIAATRVAQAHAVAAEVRGQFLPAVGYNGVADRGRNTLLGQPYTEGKGATADGFAGYLGASWELDLWGRVRRLDEEARANYYASEAGRRAILLSVVSETATAYYELLELDEDLAIAKDTAQSFHESLKLFNRQLEGGVVSRLDTASAEAEYEAALAKIPDLERQIAIKENQISLLVGHSPGPIARGATLSSEPAPPVVPAGLPSQLLERRPDVQQAEQAARAANANIGVTVGGFLPKIGLSALLGAVNPELSAITHHESFLWNVGANISGPVFQGGGLRGEFEAAKAQWEQAKLQYQQTALSAFGDVSNALVTRQKLSEMRDQQEKAVQAYQDAVRLSTERYKAGKASYFEVLQAQELLYPAQLTLAQTKRSQFTAVVQLYKALGGGWRMTEAERMAAPPAP